jgi:uncharacterized repeat protein (TIGR03803 family)
LKGAVVKNTGQLPGWISAAYRVVLTISVALVMVVVVAPSTQAQTFDVIYTFAGTPDGSYPSTGVVMDLAADLYGTTVNGGAFGLGTVYKVDKSGNETVLHSFSSAAGGAVGPEAGVVRDAAGNLYGTTLFGGTYGLGTVYKLDKSGNETVLHSFSGVGSDGAYAYAGLVRDGKGGLYSTTYNGGDYGQGTIFKVSGKGVETIYSFKASGDGSAPYGALVADGKGNFYGTTWGGGAYGYGTVFKLNPAGVETVLYSFKGSPDGAAPLAGLVMDTNGNLYGATYFGGDAVCSSAGCGTVFKVTALGVETVLHTFTFGNDGTHPSGGLTIDAEGNLYGTTVQGGGNGCDSHLGCGVLFKLGSTRKEAILHNFTGGADGGNPVAALVSDGKGSFYGTAATGGASNCTFGCGIVFKITP